VGGTIAGCDKETLIHAEMSHARRISACTDCPKPECRVDSVGTLPEKKSGRLESAMQLVASSGQPHEPPLPIVVFLNASRLITGQIKNWGALRF